jgi:hypothetical protein
MSKHVTISPTEAADRLAIRELVEAYAHCADRRDAKGQMALFTEDTHFVVYMNAKDPTPSQELHSRGQLAPVFDDLNRYAATQHFVGQSTILTLTADRATGEAYTMAHHLTVDGGTRALCRLAGGARSVVRAKRPVIVGATGMVGGYALRHALEDPAATSEPWPASPSSRDGVT